MISPVQRPQPLLVADLQHPPLPLAEIAEQQPTDRDPDQAQHLQVEGRQQAADMAVASLVEDHLQPCGLVATAQYAHGLGDEELALVLDTGAQRARVSSSGRRSTCT
jgi:hypothetical protein